MHVLDFGDDLGASLVAALQGGQVPELLKTAEWKEPYEGLDRDFALILVDDEKEHRKYACHDSGNTSVSMFYLTQAQGRLSQAAVKVAAANLARIGAEQGLAIPETIQKMAAGPYDARDVMDQRRVRYREPPPAPEAREKLAGFDLLDDIAERWHGLAPHEKRAASLELREVANSVPLVIPDNIYAYSGDEISTKFASHMRQRERWARDDVADEYGRLFKVAKVLGPEASLRALYELDKVAGFYWAGGDRYGAQLADPYLCVYGTEKEAMWSWSHGTDNVNQAQLIAFAAKPASAHVFQLTFSADLWLKFVQNPVTTFKGMPLEQQVLASRMARQV